MSNYNPKIHHRRSIRLKGYDYTQEGLYFITICCQDKKKQFGHVENKEMILNEFGAVAYNEWAKLADRFTNFELDVFQIMPDHMHAIIGLGAGFTPAPNGQPQGLTRPQLSPTVGDIIGAYKSLVAKECLKIWKIKWAEADIVPGMGKLWQRNYYEHIIRDQRAYDNISNYIINNPAKWKK